MILTGGNRSLELCARMNYETENLDLIDQMKPDSIYMDLGACEGRFSVYAALKGMKVYSFEPEKRNYSILLNNIKLNQLGQSVHPINAGVGNKNKIFNMQIGQPWAGGHQKVIAHDDVREDLNFEFKENQEVQVFTLDSVISDGKAEVPDVMKIDIDGSEIPFLEGASETLKNSKLKFLLFELSVLDKNFEFIIGKLNEFGFKESNRFGVPNEPDLYNILFTR